MNDDVAGGSFLGTASLTFPFPPDAATKCAHKHGLRELILKGTIIFGIGEIGETAGDANITCSSDLDWIQAATSSSAPSYSVPVGGGEITQWSTQPGAYTGPAQLELWRPTGNADTFVLVGLSSIEKLLPDEQNRFELQPPIPVQSGDVLGMRLTDNPNPNGDSGGNCLRPWSTGNLVLTNPDFNTAPTLGETEPFTMSNPSFILNVSARVE